MLLPRFLPLAIIALILPSPAETASLSVDHWNQQGQLEYKLNYDETQVESQITLPQKQSFTAYTLVLPVSPGLSWQLTLAGSLYSRKGRGSDLDWQYGQPSLWYAGDITFNGKQTYWSIERQKRLQLDHSTWQFIRFSQYSSTNELKNVVYHISDFTNIGSVSQPDNGSQLNFHYDELAFGLSTEKQISKQIFAQASIAVKVGQGQAAGLWNNHTPSWQWQDQGFSWGYETKVGITYVIQPNLQAQMGYSYQQSRAPYATETINAGGETYTLKNQVELNSTRSLVYAGIKATF